MKISPFLVVWGQHQQKTLQVKTKASHLQNVIGYDLMENWIIWRPCFHLSKTFCQNWTEIPFSDWQWLFWGPKLTSKLDHMVNILFLILILTALHLNVSYDVLNDYFWLDLYCRSWLQTAKRWEIFNKTHLLFNEFFFRFVVKFTLFWKILL